MLAEPVKVKSTHQSISKWFSN